MKRFQRYHDVFLRAALILSLFTVQAAAQACELINSGQRKQIKGTWILEFVGFPENVTDIDMMFIEEASMLFCGPQIGQQSEGGDMSTHQISDVALLNMEDYYEEATYTEDMAADNTTKPRPFAWAIQMTIATNVLDTSSDIFEQKRRLKEMNEDEDEASAAVAAHQRALIAPSSCACALPTRQSFLDNLRIMILMTSEIQSITDVTDMIQTEEVACAPGGDKFATTYAMDVEGVQDNITEANLKTVGNWFRATYNALDTESCDLSFRTVAEVEVTLVPKTNDTVDDERLRRLQATVTPPPTGAPTVSASPTFSASPSTFITENPTQSPTTRGPDLFTLLFSTSGRCRGCLADTSLFNDVTTGADRARRQLATAPPSTAPPELPNQCFCPIDAELRGPTSDEFLKDWNANVEAVGGSQFPFLEKTVNIEAVQRVNCSGVVSDFASYLSISFEGAPEKLTQADIDLIVKQVQDTYNCLKRTVCDEFFKIVVKVDLVQVLLRTTVVPSTFPSNMPSLVPSNSSSSTPTSARSSTAEPQPERDLQGHDRELLQNVTTMVPSISSAPSISDAPSVSPAPTHRPTSRPSPEGPVHFALVFLLEGTCQGCERDSGLFNQVFTGRKRKLQEEMPPRGSGRSRRTQQAQQDENGACLCPADTPIRTITQEEFFTKLSEDNFVDKIDAIEEVVKAGELEDYVPPTESPSLSPTIQLAGRDANQTAVPDPPGPSSAPSEFPSSVPSIASSRDPSAKPSMPSDLPTGDPSSGPSTKPSMASDQPTGFPSSGPSAKPSMASDQPTGFPSSDPSAKPSTASDQPTGFPSSDPSAKPSMASDQPTGFPSSDPSAKPSTASDQPTGFPSSDPSAKPSMASDQPTGFPSSGPSAKPSMASDQPTGSPSGQPSSNPSETPTNQPSTNPSEPPTTSFLSESPSTIPTSNPSGGPSAVPSTCPLDTVALIPRTVYFYCGASRTSVCVEDDKITLNNRRCGSNIIAGGTKIGPARRLDTKKGGSSLTRRLQEKYYWTCELDVIVSDTADCSKTFTEFFEIISSEPGAPCEGSSVFVASLSLYYVVQPQCFTKEPTSQPSSSPSTSPPTNRPSKEPSNQPSEKVTAEPSHSPSQLPSDEPTLLLPSDRPSVFPSSLPTEEPTRVPTVPPTTSTPLDNPSSRPSDHPSNPPSTSSPSDVPSKLLVTPVSELSKEPSLEPRPTSDPSESPTATPSNSPTTSVPTEQPLDGPSMQPEPSTKPSEYPTENPTDLPTDIPTAQPTTSEPTTSLSSSPTKVITEIPSDLPTAQPTTSEPTTSPSSSPTEVPTKIPTDIPTAQPATSEPTTTPTSSPTEAPTEIPTDSPTAQPTTSEPTTTPTSSPTEVCSYGAEFTGQAVADCGNAYLPFEVVLVTGGTQVRRLEDVDDWPLSENRELLAVKNYECHATVTLYYKIADADCIMTYKSSSPFAVSANVGSAPCETSTLVAEGNTKSGTYFTDGVTVNDANAYYVVNPVDCFEV